MVVSEAGQLIVGLTVSKTVTSNEQVLIGSVVLSGSLEVKVTVVSPKLKS